MRPKSIGGLRPPTSMENTMMTLIDDAYTYALHNETWEALYERQSYLLQEAELTTDVYCQLLSFEDEQ